MEERPLLRLIVMGKKSLPDPAKHGRPYWGYVDLVTTDVQDIKDALKGALESAVASLDDRERFIVEQRLMADEETSLAEIGRQLGVSRERARQLEARAKAKLKKQLGDLATAPRAPLARRFGETLLLRLDQALGHRPDPLVTAEDPREFQAVRGFLEPIGQPETIVATATAKETSILPVAEADED